MSAPIHRLRDTSGRDVTVRRTDGTPVFGGTTPGAPAEPPPSVLDIIPPAADAIVQQMRPEGVRRVVAYAEVGEGHQYTSPGEAFTALAAQRGQARIRDGRTTLTPDDWITVVAHAGDYEVGPMGLGIPEFSSLYLLDGASVHGGWRERAGSTATWGASGTLHGGGTSYIELKAGASLILEAKDETAHLSPKYLLHMQQQDYGTMIFVIDEGAEIRQDAKAQGFVCGFDGAKGSTVIFYGRGSLDRPDAVSTTDLTHLRMGGVDGAPDTLAYVGGIQTKGTLSADPYTRAEGRIEPFMGDLWVGAGTFPVVMSLKEEGTATVHVDPAHVGTITLNGATLTDRTDWPVPTGGLSARSWAKHYT